jgi:hypothetical protein
MLRELNRPGAGPDGGIEDPVRGGAVEVGGVPACTGFARGEEGDRRGRGGGSRVGGLGDKGVRVCVRV